MRANFERYVDQITQNVLTLLRCVWTLIRPKIKLQGLIVCISSFMQEIKHEHHVVSDTLTRNEGERLYVLYNTDTNALFSL
jgi:hypothetical protein